MDNYFCNQPWKYRVINISQDWYKFCCVSPEIKVSNIKDIESDQTLVDVKKSLLDNIPPSKCDYCFKLENKGSLSYRQIVGDSNRNNLTQGLAVIEVNLENTCNLRCAMCGPMYSSRWVSKKVFEVENDKLLKNLEETILLIEQNKETLQRIIISGGEPSIIPNFYRLIQKIKENLPTSAWIYINTNGMFNERLGDKFLETIKDLSNTHNVLIYWSCDGYGEVGEFLRDGLNYNTFKSNLSDLINKTNAQHTLQITTTHLNLISQIDLIEDIFNTVKVIPVKKLYPVITSSSNIKQQLMHPEILGKNILNIVKEQDINRLEALNPTYAKYYKELVYKIAEQKPDFEKIKKSYLWFKEYAVSIDKTFPESLETHYYSIGAL